MRTRTMRERMEKVHHLPRSESYCVVVCDGLEAMEML